MARLDYGQITLAQIMWTAARMARDCIPRQYQPSDAFYHRWTRLAVEMAERDGAKEDRISDLMDYTGSTEHIWFACRSALLRSLNAIVIDPAQVAKWSERRLSRRVERL